MNEQKDLNRILSDIARHPNDAAIPAPDAKVVQAILSDVSGNNQFVPHAAFEVSPPKMPVVAATA